jgi:hypothetical protein
MPIPWAIASRATSGYLSTLTPVQKNVPVAFSLASADMMWRQA